MLPCVLGRIRVTESVVNDDTLLEFPSEVETKKWPFLRG